MSNVILMGDYRAPVKLPAELTAAKTWCVWRLVQMPGEKKPRKIPYYVSGRPREGAQGSPEDLAQLVSYERAVAAVVKGGYSGVGLTMHGSNGLVGLDFDDCVVDGVILPEVAALLDGTYSEFSPSGTGVRAFFTGALADRKDHDEGGKNGFGVEFFCRKGYLTVTGNLTPDCEMWGWGETVAPLTDAVLAMYRQRFGGGGLDGRDPATDGADDDWFGSLAPKVGLSIEKATALVNALDEDCGYDEWLKAGQSLHHEFDGSETGLSIWREWSRKSGEKYPGDAALETKWASFGRYGGSPITGTWLLKHAKVARVAARYEAVADWKDKIADAQDDFDLREKICPEIGKDQRLDQIDRESLAQVLLTRFKSLDVKLPIGVVRKLVLPPEVSVPTVRQRRPLTEFGNAERMLDRFGDTLMYVPEYGSWHVWTGVYWRKGTDVEIEHYAKETVKGLLDEVEDHREPAEFYEFCARSQEARMVRNMVSLAASDPRVFVPAAELDNKPGLLCVQNGVVDLRTGKLSPPSKDLYITRVAGCDYNPSARAPLFRKVVQDVFSDDMDMVSFLQRLIGYAAIGDPVEDVMVIAHGNGSNGKSTVLRTVQDALGSYAKTAAAETFVGDGRQGSGGGPREDLLRLKGSRFVYVSEPDEQGELKEGSVKNMSGGDLAVARGIHGKDSVEFEPTWLSIMPTNHKPIVKGSDHGIWRRLVLLPFLRNFDDEPNVKDENLKQKLKAEMEGVLTWIVEGAQAYLAQGLAQPSAVRAARDQYRSQMDLLSEWMSECCITGPDCGESIKNLWLSWESWARERGMLRYITSSVALGRRLDQRFPASRDSSGTVRIRRGIALKRGLEDFFSE
jgi:P4 family phage/plasmid primase-like protien